MQEIQGCEKSFSYVRIIRRVTGFKTTKKPVLVRAQTKPCKQLPKWKSSRQLDGSLRMASVAICGLCSAPHRPACLWVVQYTAPARLRMPGRRTLSESRRLP